MNRILLLCLAAITLAFAQTKITSLPGYNGPQLNQYVGYITIDENTGKNYFYWFFESENDPANDPLIFWYQGGPGCSGLIGLFSELGPYRPDFNGGIEYNDLSWTNFANVVFLEQPVGVGFSYSDTESDYNTNDTQAALDNFVFLEKFLTEEFPEYKDNDVYLSGESYAGVYIPTVVDVIENNTDSEIYHQLKGFTIGNPVISCVSADYNAIQMNLFYYHGLVSYVIYGNWSALGCNEDSSRDGCGDLLNDAINQIGVIYQQKRQDQNEPSLDPDNLYQDFCTGNGTLEFAADQGYPDACSPVGDRVTAYLNRDDVQKALGVQPTNWAECAGGELNYTPLGNSMIPLYRRFFEKDDRQILIYSGDVDIYTVPFGYTQACLSELQDNLVSAWQPWFVNEATAGYVESFEHYSFATVKGGGHETPQYQPLTSFNMYQRFLQQNTLVGPQWAPMPREPRMTQARLLKQLGIRV